LQAITLDKARPTFEVVDLILTLNFLILNYFDLTFPKYILDDNYNIYLLLVLTCTF